MQMRDSRWIIISEWNWSNVWLPSHHQGISHRTGFQVVSDWDISQETMCRTLAHLGWSCAASGPDMCFLFLRFILPWMDKWKVTPNIGSRNYFISPQLWKSEESREEWERERERERAVLIVLTLVVIASVRGNANATSFSLQLKQTWPHPSAKGEIWSRVRKSSGERRVQQ